MKITYLGHSAVQLVHEGFCILIDPFLTGNFLAPAKASDLSPDAILLTHGHRDHVGDTLSLAAKKETPVIASFELIALLKAEGLKNGHSLNIGGKFLFEGGYAKQMMALHSNSYGEHYAGQACGYLIEWGDFRLYHGGDTALFGDMKLLAKERIDFAMLPIGGVFTMDEKDALEAVRMIQPAKAMPIHCNTFPEIKADPDRFVFEVNETTACRGLVLSPGATLELN